MENLESETNQPKMFDNLFGNSADYHFSGAGQMLEVPEHSNFNYFSNEFDSFNDIMTTFQSRTNYNEDFLQDPSNFHMDYDYHGENTMKSFTDNQNLFKNSMRKSSFISYSGSASAFRKNSFDFF